MRALALVLVMLGTASVAAQQDGTSGFFLNGGIGLGSMSYDGDSEFGAGVMLGLGWDIRLGKNVSLTPFWNGFAMSNSNVDGNVGQLGLGLTIH